MKSTNKRVSHAVIPVITGRVRTVLGGKWSKHGWRTSSEAFPEYDPDQQDISKTWLLWWLTPIKPIQSPSKSTISPCSFHSCYIMSYPTCGQKKKYPRLWQRQNLLVQHMLPQDLGILTLPGTFSTVFFMMFKDMFCTVLHVFLHIFAFGLGLWMFIGW